MIRIFCGQLLRTRGFLFISFVMSLGISQSGHSQNLPDSYAAQVEIRLTQMEQQLQNMTGQVEQLSFQMRQMQDRLDRALNDIEFRLYELEQQGNQGAEGAQDTSEYESQLRPSPEQNPANSPEDSVSTDAPQMASGTGEAQEQILGFLHSPNPQPRPDITEGMPPTGNSYVTPETSAFYQGLHLIQQQDFAAGREMLQDWLSQNSQHALAQDASYWIGQSYFHEARFVEAADHFAYNYETWPQGRKALDNLVKMAMSLARAGEIGEACRVFHDIPSRFPALPAELSTVRAQQIQHYGC